MAAAIAPVVSSLTSSPNVSLKLSAASTLTVMSTPFFGRKLVERNRVLFEKHSLAWVDVALSIVTPFETASTAPALRSDRDSRRTPSKSQPNGGLENSSSKNL